MSTFDDTAREKFFWRNGAELVGLVELGLGGHVVSWITPSAMRTTPSTADG